MAKEMKKVELRPDTDLNKVVEDVCKDGVPRLLVRDGVPVAVVSKPDDVVLDLNAKMSDERRERLLALAGAWKDIDAEQMIDVFSNLVQNAREAIECHLEGLLLDKEPIPAKKPLEQHLRNPDFKSGVLAVVDIDMSAISGKTTRVNITVPERFLKQIDEYAQNYNGNRSGFLVDAAMTFMAEHPKNILL